MRKKLSIILVLALVLATLAACTVNAPTPAPAPATPDNGGETTAPPPAQGDTVVNFLTWRGEDLAVWKELISMFEADNPGIKINLEVTSEDITEFYTVLKTRISSGEGADVFNVHPGPYINEYIDAGHVMDLGPTGIPDLYEPGYLIFGQRNGNQYGVLTTYNSIAIYYNTEIFDELGLTTPGSYEELKAVCDAVSEAGYFTVAAGFAEGWCFDMLMQPLLGMHSPDHPYTIMDLENGDAVLTEEPYVATFTDLDQFNRDGVIHKNAIGTSYDSSISLFATGQAAMLLSGTWSIGGLLEMDPDLGFALMPLPAPNAPTISPILPGQLLAINANTKVPDAAIEWVRFLSSPVGAEFYGSRTAQSTTVIGVVSNAPELAMVVDLMSGRTGDWPDNYMQDARSLDILDNLCANIWKGTPVMDALKAAQAEFDEQVVPNFR